MLTAHARSKESSTTDPDSAASLEQALERAIDQVLNLAGIANPKRFARNLSLLPSGARYQPPAPTDATPWLTIALSLLERNAVDYVARFQATALDLLLSDPEAAERLASILDRLATTARHGEAANEDRAQQLASAVTGSQPAPQRPAGERSLIGRVFAFLTSESADASNQQGGSFEDMIDRLRALGPPNPELLESINQQRLARLDTEAWRQAAETYSDLRAWTLDTRQHGSQIRAAAQQAADQLEEQAAAILATAASASVRLEGVSGFSDRLAQAMAQHWVGRVPLALALAPDSRALLDTDGAARSSDQLAARAQAQAATVLTPPATIEQAVNWMAASRGDAPSHAWSRFLEKLDREVLRTSPVIPVQVPPGREPVVYHFVVTPPSQRLDLETGSGEPIERLIPGEPRTTAHVALLEAQVDLDLEHVLAALDLPAHASAIEAACLIDLPRPQSATLFNPLASPIVEELLGDDHLIGQFLAHAAD